MWQVSKSFLTKGANKNFKFTQANQPINPFLRNKDFFLLITSLSSTHLLISCCISTYREQWQQGHWSSPDVLYVSQNLYISPGGSWGVQRHLGQMVICYHVPVCFGCVPRSSTSVWNTSGRCYQMPKPPPHLVEMSSGSTPTIASHHVPEGKKNIVFNFSSSVSTNSL